MPKQGPYLIWGDTYRNPHNSGNSGRNWQWFANVCQLWPNAGSNNIPETHQSQSRPDFGHALPKLGDVWQDFAKVGRS